MGLVTRIDHLSVGGCTFSLLSSRRWHCQDQVHSHLKIRLAWAFLTLHDIQAHVADPGMIHDLFTRRGIFYSHVEYSVRCLRIQVVNIP